MKAFKLIAALLLINGLVFMGSCSKKEETPQPQTNNSGGGGSGKDCTCGVVTSKNPATVKVTLQNICTNNTQSFSVPYAVMDNANNGDTICPDGASQWRLPY